MASDARKVEDWENFDELKLEDYPLEKWVTLSCPRM